jgi:hypothetical protein
LIATSTYLTPPGARLNFRHIEVTDEPLRAEAMPALLHDLLRTRLALQLRFRQPIIDLVNPNTFRRTRRRVVLGILLAPIGFREELRRQGALGITFQKISPMSGKEKTRLDVKAPSLGVGGRTRRKASQVSSVRR